jgi:hypothetical protein
VGATVLYSVLQAQGRIQHTALALWLSGSIVGKGYRDRDSAWGSTVQRVPRRGGREDAASTPQKYQKHQHQYQYRIPHLLAGCLVLPAVRPAPISDPPVFALVPLVSIGIGSPVYPWCLSRSSLCSPALWVLQWYTVVSLVWPAATLPPLSWCRGARRPSALFLQFSCSCGACMSATPI